MNSHSAKEAVRELLRYVGENPDREGLQETPFRVVKAYKEMCSGYEIDPLDVLKTFEDGATGYDELILLKGIEFCSLCEHHLLPFSGVAHIAYIPNGRIVGISKLARLLEIFSRRLQVQERLTVQITQSLEEHLKPQGSACILEASHSCMVCRGVKKQNSVMVTSSLTGEFRDSESARMELLQLIKG